MPDPVVTELTAEALPALNPDPAVFVDRELSWLQFNLRVLQEAGDRSVPLLERLKFLSIYYSNLDEFFMVRVGSLMHSTAVFPDSTDEKTGWTPATQLKKLLRSVADQQFNTETVWQGLRDDLKTAGIDVVNCHRMSKAEETMAKKSFSDLRPLITPQVVDSAHPIPFLTDRDPYAAALIGTREKPRLVILPLSRLPAYVAFEAQGRQKVVSVPDLVCHFASSIFKKTEVREIWPFRITRNADVLFEDDLHDFRASTEKMLRKRKRQQPVRLQISGKPSARLVSMLQEKLKISEKQTFVSSVPLSVSFSGLIHAAPGMKYDERRPVRTVRLPKGEMLPALREHDLLLSFPYQSMLPMVDMIYEAADDPSVVSIRITLYRLAASSKIAAALAYAADRGKDVLCLLELRARFDEQNNIDYSEILEDAGCTIIYGLPEQKVHSKLCLITSRRPDGSLAYITQVGTGNYNESTSEQYTDLSLFTGDEQVGRDAAAAFEALAMGEIPPLTEKLWVAPLGFKPRFLEMLERERAKGPEGFVSVKVNSLNDIDVMSAFIACSQAGVPVELFVRGICCLRPGLPGITDNITVRSVVGRHLEHSRVFVFGRGEEQRIFIGSGDLLNRNTERRVEAFIEVTAPEIRTQVLEVMEAFRQDKEKGRVMQPDGNYIFEEDGEGTSSQERLYHYFSAMKYGAEEPLSPVENTAEETVSADTEPETEKEPAPAAADMEAGKEITAEAGEAQTGEASVPDIEEVEPEKQPYNEEPVSVEETVSDSDGSTEETAAPPVMEADVPEDESAAETEIETDTEEDPFPIVMDTDPEDAIVVLPVPAPKLTLWQRIVRFFTRR